MARRTRPDGGTTRGRGRLVRALASLALALPLALVGGLAGGAIAHASEPVPLDPGFVTDAAATLDAGERAAIQDRLQAVAEEEDFGLFVVFVDAFSTPSDAEAWADDTATQGGLAPNQYLIALAVDEGRYAISADTAGPLSSGTLGAIEQAMQGPLSAGDWVGAIDAAADAATGGSGGGGGTWIFIGVIAVGGVAILVVVLLSRRRPRAAAKAAAARPLEEIVAEADSALVRMDDALETAGQELAFASAQFGEGAVAEYAAALQGAREDVARAFAIKQDVDGADESGDDGSAERRRAGYSQIIELCHAAAVALDEKAEAFANLRKLEQDAPAALERLTASHAALAAAQPGVGETLAALAAVYAPSALATVAENDTQAAERIRAAEDAIAAARGSIAAGDTGRAAVAIRDAERADAQAQALHKGVAELQKSLASSRAEASVIVDDLANDLVRAQGVADPDGSLRASTDQARTLIDRARAALGQEGGDPLAILRDLQEADARMDAALAQAESAAEAQQRAARRLSEVLVQARARVSAAEDYIAARRGAVGADARTRLAEAGAALVQAQSLGAGDAVAALAQAERAVALADQAISLAQNDFAGQGGFGGGTGGGGSNLGTALVGGLLGGMIASGGRRSRGFGGFSGGGRPSGFGGGRAGGGRAGGFGGGRAGGGRSGRF